MTPEISIVIPVYRRQESAELALRSALAQTGVAIEIVVVDDGSPEPFLLPADLSQEVRIRVIRQHNGGAASARNAGIRAARGEWIAFLDSDDVWLPNKLVGQLAFARTGQRTGWSPLTAVMCGFTQIELRTGARKTRLPIGSTKIEDFAAGCWFGPGSTALVPRTAFDTVGLFDEALLRLEDLDWYMRLGLAGGGVATWPELAVSVHVGGRPSVERLDGAVSQLRAKWLGGEALNAVSRRNLRAYLALEQANVRLHDGQYIAFTGYMLYSLSLRPRLSVPLRQWWTNGPPATAQ